MITLMRHGKVHSDRKRKWRMSELRAAVQVYDRSPVERPISTALDLTPEILIVCSDLLRSTESALLAYGRVDHKDRLFREAELPNLPGFRMKFTAPILIGMARVLWFLGFSGNCESFKSFRTRCDRVAETLIEYHDHPGSLVLVGHGILNRYVARSLLKNGFLGPKRPSSVSWALSAYLQEEKIEALEAQ